MKKLIFLIFLIILTTVSCDSNKNEDVALPECVEDYIDYWSSGSSTSTLSAFVKKYEYNGEIVYVLGANIIDDSDKVYNEKCQLICEMWGYTGVNLCEDWEEATFIETVWEE